MYNSVVVGSSSRVIIGDTPKLAEHIKNNYKLAEYLNNRSSFDLGSVTKRGEILAIESIKIHDNVTLEFLFNNGIEADDPKWYEEAVRSSNNLTPGANAKFLIQMYNLGCKTIQRYALYSYLFRHQEYEVIDFFIQQLGIPEDFIRMSYVRDIDNLTYVRQHFSVEEFIAKYSETLLDTIEHFNDKWHGRYLSFLISLPEFEYVNVADVVLNKVVKNAGYIEDYYPQPRQEEIDNLDALCSIPGVDIKAIYIAVKSTHPNSFHTLELLEKKIGKYINPYEYVRRLSRKVGKFALEVAGIFNPPGLG